MLPDLPTLKSEVNRKLQAAFRQRVNTYMGVLNEAPRYFIKEGHRVVTIRPDGHIDETELKEASAEMSIRFDQVPNLSFHERLIKLDEIAREMASQVSEHLFSLISEAANRTGNVVDGGGMPIDPIRYLDALEKISLDFDETGKHNRLTLIAPPGMEQQVEDTLKALSKDPAYRERYRVIIEKKRMAWRDREAARKLVG